MSCPHYSRENSDCLLLRESPRYDEERPEVLADGLVARGRCLDPGRSYRHCPVFRRHLAELSARSAV